MIFIKVLKNKNRKILIFFDYMVTDMFSNKRPNKMVTELFIRGKQLINFLVFITQSYLTGPKNIRLTSMHYFIIKIPNKRELHQIAFNHLSDIDFKDFMNLYKKCTAKPYSFLVIDTTLASKNPSRFRKFFLERIYKLIMTTDDKTKDEKLQYSMNREGEKISALSSGKIDKCEYVTAEKILLFDQSRVIEQATFSFKTRIKSRTKIN